MSDDGRAEASAAARPAPVAIAATGVSHRYGVRVALDDVSLRVPAGGSVALVGESGSGKTTLLRCFNRMVEPDLGTISIGTREAREMAVHALRRRIGYVPQHGGLLPHWRVRRNVELVPRLLGQPDAEHAAEDALALVGLPTREFGDRFPHELSGGQRQRVAIARAIAARPPVILLDEPFGALDAISRADLHTAFESVRAATGVTTLLVTHDLAEAARLGDQIVVMRAGRVEQAGSVAELMGAPATDYVRELLARALAGAARLRGTA